MSVGGQHTNSDFCRGRAPAGNGLACQRAPIRWLSFSDWLFFIISLQFTRLDSLEWPGARAKLKLHSISMGELGEWSENLLGWRASLVRVLIRKLDLPPFVLAKFQPQLELQFCHSPTKPTHSLGPEQATSSRARWLPALACLLVVVCNPRTPNGNLILWRRKRNNRQTNKKTHIKEAARG